MTTRRSTLFTALLSLLFTGTAHAQWVQTNGPNGGDVLSFAVSGTNFFAGTSGVGGGVFLSTNNGGSWTAVNSGLTTPFVRSLAVSPNGAGGTNLFAGTGGVGVFLSTNNGTSWTAVNNGLSSTYVNALAVSGTNFFVGTGGGVFLSTNNGTSWTAVNSGLTNPDVLSLAVSGTNLFAGTLDGVFLSTNNGTSWTAVNSGLANSDVRSLAVSGTNLFAGTAGSGVFLSTNNGTSWTAVNFGLTIPLVVLSLAVSPNDAGATNLFAGTAGNGVFLSTNNGTSWTEANSGLGNSYVYSLAVSGTNLFAGIYNVWRRPLSEMITSVERIASDALIHFRLEENYPNPFNPATTISFSVPSRSVVSLKVFDALGREVSTLVSEELSAGAYSRVWTGADLPSGVYFYRLQTGSFTETKKLILLR